jgi:hypothetical protein
MLRSCRVPQRPTSNPRTASHRLEGVGECDRDLDGAIRIVALPHICPTTHPKHRQHAAHISKDSAIRLIMCWLISLMTNDGPTEKARQAPLGVLERLLVEPILAATCRRTRRHIRQHRIATTISPVSLPQDGRAYQGRVQHRVTL